MSFPDWAIRERHCMNTAEGYGAYVGFASKGSTYESF